MELYNLKNNKLDIINIKPFKLEKNIQTLVENNTQELFNLEFIKSEFTVGKYRVDSLCFDQENNTLVIVEYKKGNSYSVIDQGYTYLQLLLNNKSDFLLALSQYQNKVLRIEDIDWSQSRIIFLSQSFNSYQKDSVNFKNLPFELYEIKRFSSGVISISKHQSTSNERIDSLTNKKSEDLISSVNKEVRVYDEEYHTNGKDDDLLLKWHQLKDRLLELEDIEITPKKAYISVITGNKAVAYLSFRKTNMVIEMLRGNINLNGSKSKNYFTIDDPKEIAISKSSERKTGITGVVYFIPFDKKSDIDYLMFLIKQKYNNLIG